MNKKLYSVACLLFSLFAGLFSSCIDSFDESDNEYLLQGYFTIGGDASQIVLYQDGGGTIYPLMSSVPSPEKFVKNERCLLQFKYRNGDISEDGNSIRNVTFVNFQLLDVHDPMSVSVAAEKNVNVADSLFAINSFVGVWAYRGFINTSVSARYTYKDSKGYYPTCNLVYAPEDVHDNHIRFSLCYNRHSSKEFNASGQFVDTYGVGPYEFPTSYRLDQLAELVPGSDSIVVEIEAKDAGNQSLVKILKVGRTDLHKGNYK